MKKVTALILALAACIGLVSCGSSGSSGSSAASGSSAGSSGDSTGTIVVKYSTTFPATGTQADGANKLGEYIAEYSEGRMKMELYPSSQLGDKVASMEGLRTGTIEMTECAATDLSSYSSIWSVFSLPYLWESGLQAVQTIMDPEVSAVLEADAEANGFKFIGWANLGSRSILNKAHAINTPADMDGLKIRCMEDPVLAGTINAMGGMATPLAWSECYTALQQGTIDGLENSSPVILANGMEEVAKYFSLTEQFIIPDPVFVSKTWFDSLSAENQEALLEAGKAFSDYWNNELWPDAEQDAREQLEAAGVAINEVDKESFIAATQSVIDDFMADADENQKALYELLMTVREKY